MHYIWCRMFVWLVLTCVCAFNKNDLKRFGKKNETIESIFQYEYDLQ